MRRPGRISIRWRSTLSIILTAGLMLSCGGDDDSSTAEMEGSTTSGTETPAPTEPTPDATAPEETTDAEPTGSGPSTSTVDTPAELFGQALADVDGERYDFVVIQCLRDAIGPFSDSVIEFQLDAVPAGTPPDIIENLLGVISEDADVLAEIDPVLEFGPILSITQVAGGGQALYIGDLDTIEIASDGDPTDPASRSLDVSSEAVGARVTGTTTAGDRTVTVDATCP